MAKISAKEVVNDIRSGMDDTGLMAKYGVSAQGLRVLFRKLLDLKVITQADLANRTAASDQTMALSWKCPACGKAQPREVPECPDCGIIVSKFLKRRKPDKKPIGEASPQKPPGRGETSGQVNEGLSNGKRRKTGLLRNCPVCGKPHPRDLESCPDCGVIFSHTSAQWQNNKRFPESLVLRIREFISKFLERQTVRQKQAPNSRSEPESPKTVEDALGYFRRFGLAQMLGVPRLVRGSTSYIAVAVAGSFLLLAIVSFLGGEFRKRSALPGKIERDLIQHYSNMHRCVFVLPDGIGAAQPTSVVVLKAVKANIPKQVAESQSPKGAYCVKLGVLVNYNTQPSRFFAGHGAKLLEETNQDIGYSEPGILAEPSWEMDSADQSGVFAKGVVSDLRRSARELQDKPLQKTTQSVLSVIVLVAQSGKITSTRIRGDEWYRGRNECPKDWDRMCPFGCNE